jgi:serpin B
MRLMPCFSIRITAFLLFCMAAGCGGNSENGGQTSAGVITNSAIVRDINPQVSDADLAAVVEGNTDFALKAFSLLDPGNGTNTVFSPYSITQAFALAAAGAKGSTLSGVEKALSFALPQELLNPAFNRLDLLLSAGASAADQAKAGSLPQLKIVNALWAQEGFPLLPAYLDTIALNYGAGLHLLDFIHAAEDSRITINTWVEDETNSRIKDLLSRDSISSDTRLVLTNAIWFKAEWASKFLPENTHDQTFIRHDGLPSIVPFMHKMLTLPYAQGYGCQAFDIPYVDGRLSMLVLMPAPGTFDAFLSAITPARLRNITNLLADRQISIALPKFTFSTGPDMGTALKTLGMTDAFDPSKADFSGIDGHRDLSIGAVVHKAYIGVGEEGTEAAAATAVILSAGASPTASLPLTVDHPFIFMIRDRQTGLILFMGKVVSL